MDSSGPSGFRNAPVTKFLVQIISGCSLAVTLLHGRSSPALRYPLWRGLSSVLAFPALGPGVVGTFLIYRMRVIERFYGSPKYAAYLFFSMMTSLIFQVGFKSYSGPHALVFAMLYQYHHIVPVTSRFPVAAGVVLTDKMYVYMAALQLLLSPTTIAPSLCGLVAGMMYHTNVADIQRWRFPQWMFPKRPPPTATPSVPVSPRHQRRPGQQRQQQQQQPVVSEDNVNAVASMFPDHSRDAVTSALVAARNDMNQAAEILLTTSSQQS
ncbi:hypothetical protein BDB00DRAFT_826662 [Zychaea mexicana]|uniref:uncharacterized protein n=1 Tax=Zychaea mexicana TaxID=64656 RepID=UPI0022FE1E31|nr:uncharacterized protein BDB00DRAFT_826662 [Zychaea mexicana]KAI9492843.1 hypothetical protein BDB00DRAFT_826662 [Zychaea mexicana]